MDPAEEYMNAFKQPAVSPRISAYAIIEDGDNKSQKSGRTTSSRVKTHFMGFESQKKQTISTEDSALYSEKK